MSKARDLADFVSAGSPLADGTISVSEVSGAAPTASPTFTGDLTVDTNTLHVDSTNNRVGIGTASPSAALDVSTGGSTKAAIFDGNGVDITHPTLATHLFLGTQTGSDVKIESVGAYPMLFRTNSAERMRIDSSGNVGIGTSSIDVSTQAGGSGYRVLQIESADGGQLNFDHNDAGTGSTLGQINFQRAGEVVAEIEGVTSGATDSAHIGFRTQATGGALTERFRIGSSGQLGIGGANYGTSGQVLTSGGSGAAPSWQSVSFTTNVITGNTTATANNHYYLNGSAITLTLPASPSVGDEVRISEVAGNTDCIIGRNGSNIMSDASDLTIDTAYLVLSLRYVDATIGWAFS